ncbi:effector protein [Salmonella enterica]|nr:effector protein [Salmonella enterica]
MPISICKHGAPFVVQHENRYGSGASQSSSLSKSIRHISNSHEEIKFISCYSANGACFSNAQMLANASVGNRLLSAPVQLGFGLKHLLTCHSNGNVR